MVFREARVQHDVHQSLQTPRSAVMHLRNTLHRPRIQPSVAHNSEASDPFGDERGAVGKECDRPRLLEVSRDDLDAEVPLFCRLDGKRSVGELGCWPNDCRRSLHAVHFMGSKGLSLLLREAGRDHDHGPDCDGDEMPARAGIYEHAKPPWCGCGATASRRSKATSIPTELSVHCGRVVGSR